MRAGQKQAAGHTTTLTVLIFPRFVFSLTVSTNVISTVLPRSPIPKQTCKFSCVLRVPLKCFLLKRFISILWNSSECFLQSSHLRTFQCCRVMKSTDLQTQSAVADKTLGFPTAERRVRLWSQLHHLHVSSRL